MFVVVVLFVLLCQVKGDLVYKCRESGNVTVDMVPAAGGILGRYRVELCTVRNPNATQWEVDLWYYKNVTDCSKLARRPMPMIHSVCKEYLPAIKNVSCNNICYSTEFDLIFGGCYNIYSVFKSGSRTLQTVNNKKFTIKNNLTLKQFEDHQPKIEYFPHDKYIQLRWIVGIPVATPFILDLWRSEKIEKESTTCRSVSSSETGGEVNLAPCDRCKVRGPLHLANISGISENCTLNESTFEVWCKLVVPEGCYCAKLRHNPLWSSVLNEKTEITYPFCLERAGHVVVGGAAGARAWSWGRGAAALCGAALLLAAALLAAALARRGLIARNFHKRVLEGWRRGRESESSRSGTAAGPAPARARRVLLLYAREGECGARAVRALSDLLQRTTCGEVLDLYSPEVMALASPAPSAWLRAALSHADTRVLLLQTPALAALYTTHVDHTNLNLLSPLLGRGAMYRAPTFGDALLPLALRLMAETLAHHHDYHKYYFATYGSLETDVLPAVVPFRRYVLPAAAHALLRDLAPAPRARDTRDVHDAHDVHGTHDVHDAHDEHDVHGAHDVHDAHDSEVHVTLINHLESAVDDFVLYVKENQNYLMEDLMII